MTNILPNTIEIEKCFVAPNTSDLFIDTFQVTQKDNTITIVGKTETKHFIYERFFDIAVPGHDNKYYNSFYKSDDDKHILVTFYESSMSERPRGDGVITSISAEAMTYILQKYREKFY